MLDPILDVLDEQPWLLSYTAAFVLSILMIVLPIVLDVIDDIRYGIFDKEEKKNDKKHLE
jgi:hypothetical protein